MRARARGTIPRHQARGCRRAFPHFGRRKQLYNTPARVSRRCICDASGGNVVEMPGYQVCRNIFEDRKIFEKYSCPACDLLLRDPVQPSCGHLLCKTCADKILERHPAVCPAAQCGDGYIKEQGVWVSRSYPQCSR